MAMNSLQSITLSLLILLQFLSLTSYCLHTPSTATTTTTTTISFRGLLYEEKTRLGSTPPSCHNKCNLCHPCMAVQVPTMPGHNRVKPDEDRVKPTEYYDQSPASGSNRYSNYKPLGWKCRCGGHLYNP